MAGSLRTRVGVVVAAFMAVGSAAAGVIASRQMSEMTHRAALREGRAVLDALAIPAAVAIATHDYTKLDNFVAEVGRTDSDVLTLIVVDHEGRLMATSKTGGVGVKTHDFDEAFTARALAARQLWFAFGPDLSDPKYLDIAKPIDQGQRWGTLLARFSLESSTQSLDRLAQWIVAVTVLAGILGWIIAFFVLERVVLAPTRALAEMARKIGEGELEVRASMTRNDEIGALGRSLDAMAERLKAYTSGLEAAVKSRTRQLEDANRALGDANLALAEANRELERLATTDGLTGLRNHRFFRNTLDFEIKRGARRIHQMALCMIDIDYFKKLNDTYGHPAGDEVLRQVGKLLADSLRGTDLVARYGGEEFAVILLDTGPDEGLRTAQKICALFRSTPFPFEDAIPGGKLTVSVGVATYPEDATVPEQLVRAADLALYEAKRRGRNNVVRYSLEIPQHTGMTLEMKPVDPDELAREFNARRGPKVIEAETPAADKPEVEPS